jgi:hypothetical protein
MGSSFLVVLAGGPLGAWPATLLVRSRLGGGLAGRLGVAAAVGGSLLGLDPFNGRAGVLSVGPLGCVMGLGTQGPVRVGDLVAAPVVFNLGRGVAPGPLAPGRLRRRAERLQDIARSVAFDRYSGGPPLPGQSPHHLPVLGAEVSVGLQPAVAALLVLTQLPLPIMSELSWD